MGDWLPETDCTTYRDPCDVATAADIDGINPCFPGNCQSLGYQSLVCDCGTTGYTGEWCDEDIKECEQIPSICGENADCIERVPDYDCYCKQGYGGAPPSCVDINECQYGNGPCHSSATCVNTLGSYECVCPGVGTPDPVSGECRDVNQCKENPGICGDFMDGAECWNYDDLTHPEGYECVCKRGVTWDGTCKKCKSTCWRDRQCRQCDPSSDADIFEDWQEQGGWEAICAWGECYYFSDIEYSTFRFVNDAGSYDFLNDNDFEQVLCEDPEEDEDGDNICDSLDECPDADDKLDFNENSVPDGCDPCFLKPCTTDQTCLVFKDSLHNTRKCVPKKGSDAVATSFLFRVLKQETEPEQFAGVLTEVFSGILNQPASRVTVHLDADNQYDKNFQVYTVLLLPGPLGGPPVLSAGKLYSQLENALRFQFFAQYDWGSTLQYTFDREVLVGWCEEELQWRPECATHQEAAVIGNAESAASSAEPAAQSGFTALYIIVCTIGAISLITFVLIVKSRQDFKNASGYQAYKENPDTTAHVTTADSPMSSPLATRRRVETILATPLDTDHDLGANAHCGSSLELTPTSTKEEALSPGLEPPSPVPMLETAAATRTH